MHTEPADLVAWLVPAAGPDAYEIGEEVFEAFVSRDPRAQAAFAATRPGHWHVDLYALARLRLVDAGVGAVHGGGLCTISDPRRFFSHRRDGRSGRIAPLAWIACRRPCSRPCSGPPSIRWPRPCAHSTTSAGASAPPRPEERRGGK